MRIIFMGRRPHAVDALLWLLAQGHDVVRVVAPESNDHETTAATPHLCSAARAAGLRVTPARELYAELKGESAPSEILDVDLVVSFLYWKRIKAPLIDTPKFGCINFHPAPLPAYRGLGGYNFAILHKLSEWGVTAHYVDSGIDTGPIIEVLRFPFDWKTATAWSLEHATRPVLLECFKSAIARVTREGWLNASPNECGHYYGRAAFEAEKRLDPDSMSPDEIDLRIRAFWYPPYDGAYIERSGRRFTLVSQEILNTLGERSAPPETV